MEALDGEKIRQAAAHIAEWLAAAWNGPAYDGLAGVLLFGPRTAMPRRCECGLRNDEFHKPVEDAGSSSRGRCRGRQCPRDDRRPFPIVYSLLAELQACTDINASTTLRYDNRNRQRIS